MDILGKLFGSDARVRLLRLFFLNPDNSFDIKDVSARTRTKATMARREMSLLVSIGIIKKCSLFKKVIVKRGRKKASAKKKKTEGWCLDKGFRYGEQLKGLLISTDLVKKNDILKRFQNAGKVKLIIISGVFIKDDNSRIDIFIVGDHLKKSVIENTLRSLEAEAGKELKYAVLDTPEFRYRLDMYDKFVRDILDCPHEVIIDRLGAGNL